MRIAILAAGSRGDYQPVLALASGLRGRGHEVGITATSDFAEGVAAEGFAVEEVRAHVMGSYREEAVAQMPGTVSGQIGVLGEWAGRLAPEIGRTLRDLWPRYDAVVSTALTLSWACVLSATDRRPHAAMLFVPALPALWGDASMLSVRQGRSAANLAAGLRAVGPGERLVGTALRELGPDLTAAQRLRAAQLMLSTPAFIAHSPEVVAPRRAAGRRIRTTGYPFRELPAGARLSPGTADFLAAGPPPVYVGFGSQSAGPTREALRHAVDAALGLGHRVLVLRGTGLPEEGYAGSTDPAGSVGSATSRPGSPSSHARSPSSGGARAWFVDDEPHELLFPRTAVVVHHGGAGTTAEALRSGTPQVVVPFILDQPFFGRRVHEIGVAGSPVPVPEATPERMAASARVAGSPTVVRRAAEVGVRVRAERGVERAVAFVEQTTTR